MIERLMALISAKIKEHIPEAYIGWWCDLCDNVHREQERCPRQVYRFCLDCEKERPLDRYFACRDCGSRNWTNKRTTDLALRVQRERRTIRSF